MPYDPKRPRQVVDQDDAPVEALLTGELPVIRVADTEQVPSLRPTIDEPVESDGSDESGVPGESGDSGGSGGSDLGGGTPPGPGRGPIGEPARGAASSVPVAPAPTEQTANRAVAAATGVAALLTLLVLLLLRRRSRQHRAD